MADTIVELDHVWVWRGDNLALKDVSLAIERGKFIGLMGPNGSGKTTLLKTIAGLIKPDRGRVKVTGPTSMTFGYVPQEEHIDPDFSVNAYDVVDMRLDGTRGICPGIGPAERERIDRKLVRVGMQYHSSRIIGDLSGGMKQRVCIAIAISLNPQIIIADEPTSALDVVVQWQVIETLRKVQEELGAAVIQSGHDMGLMAQ